MQTLGELFKNAREERKISIKQASTNLRIRESMLESLENSDYSQFSSDTHLKSFLRAYAKFLEINEDRALAMYRRERRIEFPEDRNNTVKEKKDDFLTKFAPVFFNIKTLVSVALVILILTIVAFFYSQWRAFNQPPTLTILSPEENSIITTENFVIEGITDNPSIKVLVDGNQANFVDTNGRFKVNARFTEPGTKRFSIVAENEFTRKTEVIRDLTYRAPEKETPRPKIRVTNNGLKTIALKYTVDSKSLSETINILPAATSEIEFNTGIKVDNFDQANLSLYINEDETPTNLIDGKEFSIIIENSRPIIKIIS